MMPFSITLNFPNSDFKVRPLFYAEYLKKRFDVQTYSYNGLTHAVLKDATSSDLERLSEIFNDTKHRAVSLRQLSFLFSSESGIFHAVTYVHHRLQLQQQGINAVTAQISCDSTERA